jgi:hypothetical protein
MTKVINPRQQVKHLQFSTPYFANKCPSKKCTNTMFIKNHINKQYLSCQHCNKKYCSVCIEANLCDCGFICEACRKISYTRECFICDDTNCNKLLCQVCLDETICTECTNAYCVDCQYVNISTCMSCGEIKCNNCMKEVPDGICLNCKED